MAMAMAMAEPPRLILHRRAIHPIHLSCGFQRPEAVGASIPES